MKWHGTSAWLTAATFVAAAAFGSQADEPALLPDEQIFDYIASDAPDRVLDVVSLLDRLHDPRREDRIQKAQDVLRKWREELTGFCAERGINPYLAAAVITAESNGRVSAESHAGAGGLMQLMPGTADGLSVADRKRAADNIYGGCRYLSDMLAKHGGNEVLALAAYNAGPGAVAKHGGVPPYRETRAYVIRVARAWPERTETDAASSEAPPSPTTASIEFTLTPRD